MTQFQPPPPPTPLGTHTAGAQATSPRWSVSAIAGFVLSLLGCTGIGAILGLILGIVGIVVTRDGRRRGLGLAIAAIPISLVTGTLSVFIALGMFVAAAFLNITTKLPELLELDASGIGELRKLTTDDFDDEVADEDFRVWLAKVGEKHGKLISISLGTSPPTTSQRDGHTVFSFPGKFVNGNANISVVLSKGGIRDLRIDDVEVDGVSPRPPG